MEKNTGSYENVGRDDRMQQTIDSETVSLLAGAYTMMAEGEWEKAEALFDKVLEKEPENERALTGKQIIKRRNKVHERILSMQARLPDEELSDQDEEKDDYIDPKITRKPQKNMGHQASERARMRTIALIVALLLIVSAAAATIALRNTDQNEPDTSGEQTVQFG